MQDPRKVSVGRGNPTPQPPGMPQVTLGARAQLVFIMNTSAFQSRASRTRPRPTPNQRVTSRCVVACWSPARAQVVPWDEVTCSRSRWKSGRAGTNTRLSPGPTWCRPARSSLNVRSPGSSSPGTHRLCLPL